jgi:ribonuclease HI
MATQRSTGVVMHIDGASRGNPGPAAYAVVVKAADGAPLAGISKFLGRATNNVAEYEGLLAALGYALRHHQFRLRVVSDSELLVRQVQGSYKVKSPDLKPLHLRAREMIARLAAFSIEHVRREQNREADRLVNQALDAVEARTIGGEPRPFPVTVLRAAARHFGGVLKLQHPLPLTEGEEVELEIRRKK